MIDEHMKALIDYRIERAEETYKEALLMKDEDHWNACANRLYYACFYAVSALLIKYGLSSSKHSGIKSLFNQNIIYFRSKTKGAKAARGYDTRNRVWKENYNLVVVLLPK